MWWWIWRNFFEEQVSEIEVTPKTTLNRKIRKIYFFIDLATIAMVAKNTEPAKDELQTFNKARNHPNAVSWGKCQGAIWKELGDTKKQHVWRKLHKSLMPPFHRCVKNKWVFKIKCNRVYQACLVACKYSQIWGVDFPENYSPVVNHIIFCIQLLMVIHFGFLAKIVKAKKLHHFKPVHPWPCSSRQKN